MLICMEQSMKTISKTVWERWTSRVTANETVDGILIRQGEKLNIFKGPFDTTCVILTREEITKLAELFPVRKNGAR